MTDINDTLEEAYFAKLNDGAPCGVYNDQLPNNINPDSYIVFRVITNSDASTQSSSDLSPSVMVEIHTVKDVINQSTSVNALSAFVLSKIYPDPQYVLPLTGAQMLSTRIANDRRQDFSNRNQRSYISRYITFRHQVFVNS